MGRCQKYKIMNKYLKKYFHKSYFEEYGVYKTDLKDCDHYTDFMYLYNRYVTNNR